jgi:hypothetical protein
VRLVEVLFRRTSGGVRPALIAVGRRGLLDRLDRRAGWRGDDGECDEYALEHVTL